MIDVTNVDVREISLKEIVTEIQKRDHDRLFLESLYSILNAVDKKCFACLDDIVVEHNRVKLFFIAEKFGIDVDFTPKQIEYDIEYANGRYTNRKFNSYCQTTIKDVSHQINRLLD